MAARMQSIARSRWYKPIAAERDEVFIQGDSSVMSKKATSSEVTGKKAASAAAKVLRDPKASPAAKSAAGSALTQRPNRKK
jgi:hypothetical protein